MYLYFYLFFSIHHTLGMQKLGDQSSISTNGKILQIKSAFAMNTIILFVTWDRKPRLWRSGLERSPRKRKVGCSNPSCNIPKLLKHKWQLQCQTLGNRCECHESSDVRILIIPHVTIGVARLEPSLLNEC